MAAEVISLGVWLDHIPLPVFSCYGRGFVVGQAGRGRKVEGQRKKEERRGRRGGGGRKGYGERQVEGGLRDGQCRRFSPKLHQCYAPEVARLVHMSSSPPFSFCLLLLPNC